MIDQLPAHAPAPPAAAGFLTASIIAAAGVVAALSLLFLAFPGLDLWASGAFYAPGRGFFLAADRALVVFRYSVDWLIALVAVILLASVLLKLAWPEQASRIAPSRVLFLLSSLLLGPGLLVNLILKNHWGRPRPGMISAFGGHDPYVLVWEISSYCSRNCSFVAGEASAAAWLIGAALVLPGRWRVPGVIAACAYALLIGANRIAFGGHFLSDVLLSFGLTFLVMALLHRFFVERPPAALAD